MRPAITPLAYVATTLLMMMPMRPMNVTVLNFLVSGGAHIDDLDLEAQSFARHGVVAVEHDLIALYFHHRKDHRVAIVTTAFELPADFHARRKLGFRNGLQQAFVAQAESVRWRQFNRGLEALLLALQRCFYFCEGVAVAAMQIRRRLLAGFQHLS